MLGVHLAALKDALGLVMTKQISKDKILTNLKVSQLNGVFLYVCVLHEMLDQSQTVTRSLFDGRLAVAAVLPYSSAVGRPG